MARTRVTCRPSRASAAAAASNPSLGECVRSHGEFTEAAREACADATAAQRGLQARCAAAAAALPAEAQPLAGLGALNRVPELLLRLLCALPPDERARLALVHSSWAAFLARPACWQALDLLPAGGVVRARVTDALLRGAAARAGGALHTLDLSDALWRLCTERRDGFYREEDEETAWRGWDEALKRRPFVSLDAALSVVAANADSLRVLRAHCALELCDAPASAGLRPPQLRALLRAAPALAALNADAACMPDQAPALLRGDAPYGPLRLRRLALCGQYRRRERDDPAARPGGDDHTLDAALAVLLRAHAPLRELELDRVHLAPGDEAAAAAVAACVAGGVRALCVRGADGAAADHGHAPALFHEAEVLEVRCTDALLALDELQDAAERGAAGAPPRSHVRSAVARVRGVAATLAQVKEAAMNAV